MAALRRSMQFAAVVRSVSIGVCLAGISACGGGSSVGLPPTAPLGCTATICLRIAEMWSGQFPQVTTNGFGDKDLDAGTEGARAKFILMAARANNVAHFLVAVESTGEASTALVRLGVLIDGKTFFVGPSYPIQPGRIELSVDLASDLPPVARDLGPLDFVVLAGVDRNANRLLESDEEVVRSDWIFRVVPDWYYRASLADLVATEGALKAFRQLPLAVDFASAFSTGQAPAYFPPRETVPVQGAERQWEVIRATFGTSDPRIFNPATELDVYSHKAGIDYNASNRGLVGHYFFDPSSQVTRRLLESELMKQKVIARLLAAVTPSRPFARLRTAERFEASESLELFFAFGTVYVDAFLFANVDCTNGVATLRNVELRGYLWDLYDFNFSSQGEAVAQAARELASVQAGYGTLGTGTSGQIFEILVSLQTFLPEHDGQRIGDCSVTPPPPPQPCPSLVGEFSVYTTYEWVCHGSYLAASFSGSRTRTQSVVEGQQCWPTMSAPVKRNGYIDNNTTVYARSVVDSELAAPFRSEYDFELTGEGTIFANGLQIVFNEYGLVYGEINGVPGRCSSRATSVWTR